MNITILGGGPAGISVGYYAQKNGISFRIYEASNQIGGNCITIKYEKFLFDLGAHRVHNKNEEITTELIKLLEGDLQKVNAPSQVYYRGKYIDFPLSPLDLLTKLGIYQFSKAGFYFLKSRCSKGELKESFESLALHNYGKIIADLFLLNYSEKLWGLPCSKLSSNISGDRLKGLNLITFLTEAFLGKTAKTRHLDGSFYYPKMGYGTITERMGQFCGQENISLNSRITKVWHNSNTIDSIEINHKTRINVEKVVSTLPLSCLLHIMEPSPPEDILILAKNLRYRNLRLVSIFLNKKSVTANATIYFPEPVFPFTRVYEPKNRSIYMSPLEKTSLVAEIPCQYEDEIWNLTKEEIINLVKKQFIHIGWIKEEEIINSWVGSINYAYPVLEIQFEDKIQRIMRWLDNFSNLNISGRNGKFIYTHLHDQMKFGQEIIEQYISNK